jgi:hypothetical protein
MMKRSQEKWHRVQRAGSLCIVLLTGCSFDRAGLDTASPPLADTAVVDSTVPDIEPEAEEDTGSVSDSLVLDAFDSVVVDSRPEVEDSPPKPPRLEMTGEAIPVFGNTDLSAEGKVGWAHWGLLDAKSFTRKVSSSSITQGTTLTADPALQFGDYYDQFSWNDGDPVALKTNVKGGIYITAAGAGFTFDVDATAEDQTLRVYMEWNSLTGIATASLSDKAVTDANLAIPPPGVVASAENSPAVYMVKFRTPTPGAKLRFSLRKTAGTQALTLRAATLQ